ncbi:MAG TPA: ribonuclease D [Gemmatimonadales bacterium]|nr:ribonuclease D [Gemmatimonadales bacterium]
MSGYQYVRTSAALDDVMTTLALDGAVAVDTEAASFHRYRDRIYLIQLSNRSLTAIVDPLALETLAPLGALLAEPRVEKVFHDADYDLRVLDRDYGFRAANLFDTRVAAQLAGEPALGLAALLEKYAGVRLAKEFQKADWSRRPLTDAMLEYAADDTRHLLGLRDRLSARLEELGRLSWAAEEFRRLEGLRWNAASDGPDAYLRVKGARALADRQRAALGILYDWRERVAAEQDRAKFRVVGNDVLVAVSRALPQTVAALVGTPGVPASLAERYQAPFLDAVSQALALPEAALPRFERPKAFPRDAAFEARVERLKNARNEVARALGLDPGVLCSRGILEAVARAMPADPAALAAIPELRRWQVSVLGPTLLAALA